MVFVFRIVAFGLFCWLTTTQDLLSWVENGEFDEDHAIQRFHSVERFASILSSAPILADDGVPLQIGSGGVPDAEEIVSGILGAVDMTPPVGWEQVAISGLPGSSFDT